MTLLIDTQYVEHVVADMHHYFGPKLGRELPKADLALWLDYLVLDAGLMPGDNQVTAVWVHPKGVQGLEYFTPSNFETELNGQAFKDNLGEFVMQSVAVESIVSAEQMIADCIEAVRSENKEEDIVVVAQAVPKGVNNVQWATMPTEQNPQPADAIIMGFSLMGALGIAGNEI